MHTDTADWNPPCLHANLLLRLCDAPLPQTLRVQHAGRLSLLTDQTTILLVLGTNLAQGGHKLLCRTRACSSKNGPHSIIVPHKLHLQYKNTGPGYFQADQLPQINTLPHIRMSNPLHARLHVSWLGPCTCCLLYVG